MFAENLLAVCLFRMNRDRMVDQGLHISNAQVILEKKMTKLTEQVEDGKYLVPVPQYRADRYHMHMPHNPTKPGLVHPIH